MQPEPYTDIRLPDVERIAQQPDTLLVDVRDAWEFEEFNIGGLNVPLPDIRARHAELLPYKQLILVCTNGVRSRIAAKDLRRFSDFDTHRIWHLHGGIIGDESA